VENYQEYHQLQQQQNYRLDKDMLMDKTKQKREFFFFRICSRTWRVGIERKIKELIEKWLIETMTSIQNIVYTRTNLYLFTFVLCALKRLQ
jgi:hypothetical protein